MKSIKKFHRSLLISYWISLCKTMAQIEHNRSKLRNNKSPLLQTSPTAVLELMGSTLRIVAVMLREAPLISCALKYQ